MYEEYTILFRDCNGGRFSIQGERSSCYQMLVDQKDNLSDADNYEILAVFCGDAPACVWSSLMSDHPLDYDDLLGFLA